MKIVALNKSIQALIKRTDDKKFYSKLDRNLPQLETLFAGICYCTAIQLQSSIPKERKPSLMYQAVIGCLAGITVSKVIDRAINKHKERLVTELEKRNLPKMTNIIKGTRVLFPLLTAAMVTRFLIPTLSIPVSTLITRHTNKKKLDKKA